MGGWDDPWRLKVGSKKGALRSVIFSLAYTGQEREREGFGGRGRMGEGVGGSSWEDDPWRLKVGSKKGALRSVIFSLACTGQERGKDY